MKKYSIERLYPLEQYGNIKYVAKGLKTLEEIKAEQSNFDKLAQEYKDKPAEVSGTLKVAGTKQEFILNKKDGLLYEKINK